MEGPGLGAVRGSERSGASDCQCAVDARSSLAAADIRLPPALDALAQSRASLFAHWQVGRLMRLFDCITVTIASTFVCVCASTLPLPVPVVCTITASVKVCRVAAVDKWCHHCQWHSKGYLQHYELQDLGQVPVVRPLRAAAEIASVVAAIGLRTRTRSSGC